MYKEEDEHFHLTTIDETEFDFQVREPSLFSESTGIDSNRMRMKKLGDSYKKMDKDYQKIKVKKGFQFAEVEFYTTTASPGVAIRDALTGAKNLEHRVGSKNEDFYFKTNWSVGSDMKHLYFDSPEQYERLMNVTLSESVKQKWMEKCVNARRSVM
jgi:hypothetical protein